MPATLEQINDVLESSEFDEADKAVVRWQFRMTGDFEKALWEVIMRADENNLRLLALGYPHHVLGYSRWAYGDLGNRLRRAGLPI